MKVIMPLVVIFILLIMLSADVHAPLEEPTTYIESPDSEGFYNDSAVLDKMPQIKDNFKKIKFKPESVDVFDYKNTQKEETKQKIKKKYNMTDLVVVSQYEDQSSPKNINLGGWTPIKQKFNITNHGAVDFAFDFVVVTEIADSSFYWNNTLYNISVIPFIVSAKRDQCFIEQPPFENYYYECITGGEIYFGNSYYAFSDIVDFNHTISLYSDNGSNYIKMNISNLLIASGESIFIDPIYGTGNNLSAANQSVYNRRYDGAVASDDLGWSTTTGDVNDDGKSDLIIGANYHDSDGLSNNGAVYVIYSNNSYTGTGNNISLAIQSNYNLMYGGSLSNDNLGTLVTTGDVNGDGKPDLIMGANHANFIFGDNGAVYIVYSNNSYTGTGNNISLATSSNYNRVYYGSASSFLLGASISVGDVNGDNKSDLIMGEKGYLSGGRIYVVYSNSSYTGTGNNISLATSSNYNLKYTGASSERLEVTAVGDVNGDDKTDLIMGDGGADANELTDVGAVYIVYSNNSYTGTGNNISLATSSNYNLKYIGEDTSDYLGTAVLTGDFNDDGKSDLIMGASYADIDGIADNGAVYVVYSNSSYTGTGNNISLAIQSNYNIRYAGELANDRIGVSVIDDRWNTIFAGDTNMDNKTDLIIGAGHADVSGLTDNGAVYIIYSNNSYTSTGNNLSLAIQSNYNLKYFGSLASDYLGSSVATGDINKDTGSDLVMGSAGADTQGLSTNGAVFVIYNSENSPPTINSVFTSPNGTVYAGTAINASFSIDDVDTDQVLNVTVKWFNNNVENTTYNCNMANTSFRDITRNTLYNNNSCGIPINSIVKNRFWIAEVTATDGTASVSLNTSALNISNTLPTNPTIYINTSSPLNYTTGNLTFYNLSAISDADNDTTRFKLKWFNNSVIALDLENQTMVLHTNTTKGQGWIVEAWPFDGTEYGLPANTTNLSIRNTPPTVTSASLNSPLYANSTMTCTGSGAADDDNDALTHYYKFNRAGIIMQDWTTDNTAPCNNTACPSGTTVYCAYNVSDGEAYSNQAVSVGVAITNLNPAIHQVFISPNGTVYRNTSFNTAFNVTDFDTTDSVNVTIKWFTNAVYNSSYGCAMAASPFRGITRDLLYNNNSCSLPINATVKNRFWITEITVWDGTAFLSMNSSAINISNIAPTTTTPSITPATAYLNTTLNATAVYSDLDEDIGTMWFKWFVDHILTFWESITNLISGQEASSLLKPGNYSAWQNVSVQVTPYDGEINGTSINSSINISNHPPDLFINFVLNATSADVHTLDNLTVYNLSGINDLEDDYTIFRYRWFNNSVRENSLENQTIILYTNTSAGQVWIVELTPFDGYAYGPPANSSSLTINASPISINNYGADGDLSMGANKAFWPWINITANYNYQIISANFTVFNPFGEMMINNTNGTNYQNDLWKSSANLTPLYPGNWLVYVNASLYKSGWFYNSTQFNVTIGGGIEFTSWKIVNDGYGANNSIRINMTRGQSIQYFNCTVDYPNGTMKLNWTAGSLVEYRQTYEVWDCPYFLNDVNSTQYPGWTANISTGNADANESFADPHWYVKDRWVWNPDQFIYSMVYNPPDTVIFNLSLDTYTNANLTYNFTIEGWNIIFGNYYINYDKLNFTNKTIFFNNITFASDVGSEGTYYLNISMWRIALGSACPTCQDRHEVIPVILYNNPPAGKLGMNLSTGVTCSATTGNCDWVPSPFYPFSDFQYHTWLVYNSGAYNLSGCYGNLTGEISVYVSSHSYFIQENLTIEPHQSQNITIYTGPSDAGDWTGYLDINCMKSNNAGNPTHLLPDQRPKLVIRTKTWEEFVAAGGGAGGGPPEITTKVNVTLLNITAICGNFECEEGENATSCPLDCITPIKPLFNLDAILCIGDYAGDKCPGKPPWLVWGLFITLIAGLLLLMVKGGKKKRKETKWTPMPEQAVLRKIDKKKMRKQMRQQRPKPFKVKGKTAQEVIKFLGIEKQ